jgi:hypothetical protein
MITDVADKCAAAIIKIGYPENVHDMFHITVGVFVDQKTWRHIL